jgi:osmotically-inducible protein OsmY
MTTLKQDITRLREDQHIKRDVHDELEFDPSVTDANAVEISVRDGSVTLGGTADSLAQRWAIRRAALRVRGVRELIDELIVLAPKPDRRDDCDIEDAANMALRWDARVPDGVVAGVNDGWLTLRGAVSAAFERAAAFDAVRNLVGLRGISNEIEVAPAPIAPDFKQALAAAVKRRVDSGDVQVDVVGNTVVLSGRVSSYAEREEIEQAATMAAGAMQIDDQLRIDR